MARASGSKVYLYFMKKGRQARHRIPRTSCYKKNLPKKQLSSFLFAAVHNETLLNSSLLLEK